MDFVPTPADVAAFLGQSDDETVLALAGEHVAVITAMARAYTRNNGFGEVDECAADLAAVITTATARLIANPEQIRYSVGSTQMLGGFAGWTLAETFVLNRYRKRSL